MSIMNNQESIIVVPLGQALKNARLVANLSIEEVAEQLNLGISAVREFEDSLDVLLTADKYPAIYLRGYLTNYGKLVGLGKLNHFAEYQQLSLPDLKNESLIRRPVSRPMSNNKKSAPWFSIFLTLLVVIAVVYFMLQRATENSSVESNDFSLITTKTGKQPLKLPIDVSLETGDVVKNEKQVTAIDAPVEDVSVTASSKKQLIEKEASVNEVVEVVESLALTFFADCWTEIHDAKEKRLAFDLYKEGHILTVKGVPPFKLKLGDPSAVEIQYQDITIKRESVAGRSLRFSVPEK